MGLNGLPGRSMPDARLFGVAAFALPATDLSFDRTLFARTGFFLWLPFLKGVLNLLSLVETGLSPFVFCASAAGMARKDIRSNRQTGFQNLE